MIDSVIRVGVVGAGGNTKLHHLPKLQAIEGVEVVAVSNRTRGSGQAVADEFGIPRVADHWSELIADPEIDAIVIGTWPNLHAQVTIAALESGKHVLCEARLARTVAEAKQMIVAAERRPRLITQVVPSPFTLEYDATISRLLGEGYLGDLVAVEITDRSGFVDPAAARTWRQTTAISGVNIMSLGIWYEAMQRWLGDAAWVMAAGRTMITRRPGAGGASEIVDVPDHLDVIGALPSGAQLRIAVSQVTGHAPANGVWLYGTDGTLRLTGDGLFGARRGEAEPTKIDIPDAERIGWRVEEEFIGAIRGSEPVRRTTFADGLGYLIFTEAVWRSVRERRVIHLSELA
ncbi:Gfo/Idh/MocA family protein [Microlunatus parietis]|uniref:Putative dehydrogenase n=1 Tax=Microlunatus parietis TaxID=682979 RepID=A0A7Y9LD52_9ACTN|nr:Gfo/Idh/MocA family oxidoreductase [Microlunatus parietis]NYE73532.1 putative dehydrogenase [Microlunatus parietis]